MRALSLLCVIVGLWESSLSNRNCPDLIVDSCHCSAERSKELSRQHVRVKVVCDDVDLMDTLQPSFLPNRTVSLNLSNNKISLLRNGSFYGLAALEKLMMSPVSTGLVSAIKPFYSHPSSSGVIER
ncbi:Adhesion G protein-coupled receptor A2 [Collichthys lucidus]|uniref:Adhesion G protein-coupled receptor A2 n=1 Tax=Collichthys lucidus TaxID=240159 RepID=A0A4U5VCI5_COLLU|nr:Adhesion G protein-coupled receptor A2 [Collichthys lucidus]